ncbi:MAG: ABC transporter ATP-binding protein [Chloroflexota bacterium]|nr:MAG: ABC transporter ATP-binding protein [Chloroflexota bacterium]
MALIELRGVSRRFGVVTAVERVDLSIERGEIIAIVGPSGSGKTTTLRLIAGFERPDEGTIVLDGKVVADARARAFEPPEKRGVGVVFQDLALFPHLTVSQNVGFGLAGTSPNDRRDRVGEVLATVGIESLADRYPDQLSGGQQQRVALARALAPSPSVVLLDEPFASLDADSRAHVREEIRRILRTAGATAIVITHDQTEALALADRVAVMRLGRFEQFDVPLRIYHAPASRFVADFIGHADFVLGTVTPEWLETEAGRLSNPGALVGTPVDVMIRPDEIDLEADPGGTSTIIGRQFRGPEHLYTVRLPSGREIHSVRSSTDIIPLGMRVRPILRPTNYVVFRGGEAVAAACLAENCRCALAEAAQRSRMRSLTT